MSLDGLTQSVTLAALHLKLVEIHVYSAPEFALLGIATFIGDHLGVVPCVPGWLLNPAVVVLDLANFYIC